MVATALAWKVLPDPPPDVLVIGDSVSYLAAGELQQQFNRDHLQFVTTPGFTSTELIPLVDEALTMHAKPAAQRDQVGALVGYNDVRINKIDTPSLPELVETTSDFRCGIWLTVPSRPGGKDATNPMARSDLVDQWNVRLVAEVEKYPNLHLVEDWAEAITEADVDTYLREDGVHPNDAGQALLAQIYRDGLARYC